MKQGLKKTVICVLLCAGLILGVYFTAGAGPGAAAPTAAPTDVPTVPPETEPPIPADAIRLEQPGLYRVDGWLYDFAGETESPVWAFDETGRYTTGDGQLDAALADALHASGADALEGDAALRAAYLYIKNEFHYKVREADAHTEENGSVDWINERALRFLSIGGGTCYGYAAAFGLLARCIGFEAHIVAGEVNQFHEAHAFVVIQENGDDYIYDVEMEDARPERHDDLDLYRQTNHAIYSYWYEPAW